MRASAIAAFLFLSITPPVAWAQAPSSAPATLFTDGVIHTLDPQRPRAEAILVVDGRIAVVGARDEAQKQAPADARVVSLLGAAVIPGLIDAHAHLAGLGSFALGRLDLSAAKSFDDVVATVAERVRHAKPGEWILGGRWDDESWPQRRLPTHEVLTAASPDNPVWLTRVDGHAGVANAAAMKLAGAGGETPSPAGGEIVRGPDGSLTGVFIDNAMELIEGRIDAPQPSPEELILKAQELCLAAGLTGVHDAGVTPGEVAIYEQLAAEGRLKLRVYAMIAGAYAIPYFAEHPPRAGERVAVRACKLYADGALGSRGAWLLAPYADRPSDEQGHPYTGLAVMPPELIRRVAEDGLRRGYQVCTHAIGDRGNRETLDAYAYALRQRPTPDHRYRIEHAQVLSPTDIPRFAALGVVASMQPTHCTSDMRWAEARIGAERLDGAYAWQSLLRSGARLALGSDFPVESNNPFLGLYAAVTRKDLDGKPPAGWRAAERLTREQALRGFTLDAAYAAFEEKDKGSLEVGKLADFVVLDRDILTCPEREIAETKVRMTVVGGEIVYRAAEQGD